MTDNNPYPLPDPLCVLCGGTFKVYCRYTNANNDTEFQETDIEPQPEEPSPEPFDLHAQQDTNWVRSVPGVHAWSDTCADLMGTGAQSHDPLQLRRSLVSPEVDFSSKQSTRNADINVICNADWYGQSTRACGLMVNYDRLSALNSMMGEYSLGEYKGSILGLTEMSFEDGFLGFINNGPGMEMPPTFPSRVFDFDDVSHTNYTAFAAYPSQRKECVGAHWDCLFVVVNSVLGKPLFAPATFADWEAVGESNILAALNSVTLQHLAMDKMVRAQRRGLFFSEENAVMGLEFMMMSPMPNPQLVDSLRFLLLESDRFTVQAAPLNIPEAAATNAAVDVFDGLPTELLMMIVGYLDARDLRRLEWASTACRKLLDSSHFWWQWIETHVAAWFPELVALMRKYHDRLDRIDMRRLAGWALVVSREAQHVTGHGMVLAKRRRILRLSQTIIERMRFFREINPPAAGGELRISAWDCTLWPRTRLSGPFSKQALAQKQSIEYLFGFVKDGEVREIIINTDPKTPLISDVAASTADVSRFGDDPNRLFIHKSQQVYSVILRLGIARGRNGQNVQRIMSVIFHLDNLTYRELPVPGVEATHHCYKEFMGFEPIESSGYVKTVGMRQTWATLKDGTDAIVTLEPVQLHEREMYGSPYSPFRSPHVYWGEMDCGNAKRPEPWAYLVSMLAELLPPVSPGCGPEADVTESAVESLLAFSVRNNEIARLQRIVGYEREVVVNGVLELRYAGIGVTTRLGDEATTQFLGVTAEQAAQWEGRLMHSREVSTDVLAPVVTAKVVADSSNSDAVLGIEMAFTTGEPLVFGCQKGKKQTLPVGILEKKLAGFVGSRVTEAGKPAILRMAVIDCLILRGEV